MFLNLYIIAFPVFFVLDMLWLGFVAKKFYSAQVGFMMKKDINWVAAISFYLLFVIALVFFVVMPAIEKNSLLYALLVGAFFGFVSYATYDLTNLATTKDWPLSVTIVDMLWGAVLASTVSSVTYLLVTMFSL